ncbi:MAG: deoxyribodipyrimidine photolyase [Gemmatimonadota bacterium]|nr:deoxyribodipyrimidine photolyase [Gemmatimonadota bacterium]MDH3422812.1 deoxyribodipyrimidine photolyase [Gemmatimonadota bacterium]
MVATRRLTWNYALDRAVEHATALQKPLLILEPINVDYPWASDRHHRAILDGMQEHDAALKARSIGYYPYVEPKAGAGSGLLAQLAALACVVVTDDSPVFFTPALLAAASRLVGTSVEAVDSCGLLPLQATDRTFNTAYSFRRFLQKELPEHLMIPPDADGYAEADLPALGALPPGITDRWPRATPELLERRSALAGLPLDHSVGPTDWVGGHATARTRLTSFIETDLRRYGEERSHPDADVASRLSPWLHYGQLSVHEVFTAVADWEDWGPTRLSARVDGRKNGWWGMSPSAEAFLDELITWRELGYVFATREPHYTRYDTLPEWAKDTLEVHAEDPREHIYSLDELANSETDDELWNAAQRQLVHEGVVQNYLRMLWGKRIIEWTAHPREALAAMIELNNRYALDGRDPNSYSGIFWVLGRFDRGWPERAVFGKVRSMTSRSTRRKMRLTEYLERWGV